MINEWLNGKITEMCGVWICEWMNVEKRWVGMVIEIEMSTVTKRTCKILMFKNFR